MGQTDGQTDNRTNHYCSSQTGGGAVSRAQTFSHTDRTTRSKTDTHRDVTSSKSQMIGVPVKGGICLLHLVVYPRLYFNLNPLKPSGAKWLHLRASRAILV